MRNHYRPPPGPKRYVATAAIAAMLVVGVVYAAFDKIPMVTLPTFASPPERLQSFSKSEPDYGPSPLPRTVAVPAPQSKDVAGRRLGPGIYRCDEANGAVTYSDTPCDGKLVDTKPTSGGFAENWSITVKGR